MLNSLLVINLFTLAVLLFFGFRFIITSTKLNQQNQNQLQEMLQRLLNEQRHRFDEHQFNTLKALQESITQSMQDIRQQLHITLNQQTTNLNQSVDKLTQETQQHLKDISGQVEQKLNQGFEKTNQTFINVLHRLTIIDEAQKKITELSNHVVSLQEVLSDKRSRGAFGEVQLNALIRNMLPEANFSLQYSLSNQTRVDCILFLPEPSGNIAIDAKFPLENYHKLISEKSNTAEKQKASTQFRQDIRKHIKDIANKYIIPGETADGAMMFIPAEAIFAEIHSRFADVVEFAHQSRVWLVSPTTMMAILTTARAVIKDAATRQQIHIIQEHLIALNQDFSRFQHRMDNLAKHIEKAHEDVEQVHKSSRKITRRFQKIEQVELDGHSRKIDAVLDSR